MWPFDHIDKKIKYPCGCVCKIIEENKKLKAENEFLEKDVCKDYRIQSMYLQLSRDGEVIEILQKENLALRRKQQEMAREGYGRHLPEYGSNETWYDLKAEIMKKDREIETLKALLKFTEEDKQEWEDHKEIFNFMVKKSEVKDKRIKELEGEERK